MKKYTQRETAAIVFLSSLDLKQGVDKVYFMIDLFCMGLLELQGTQSKREIHQTSDETGALLVYSYFINYKSFSHKPI